MKNILRLICVASVLTMVSCASSPKSGSYPQSREPNQVSGDFGKGLEVKVPNEKTSIYAAKLHDYIYQYHNPHLSSYDNAQKRSDILGSYCIEKSIYQVAGYDSQESSVKKELIHAMTALGVANFNKKKIAEVTMSSAKKYTQLRYHYLSGNILDAYLSEDQENILAVKIYIAYPDGEVLSNNLSNPSYLPTKSTVTYTCDLTGKYTRFNSSQIDSKVLIPKILTAVEKYK